MLHEWLVVHRKTEADYWWFVNKRRLVRALLSRYAEKKGTLLEVGCGGGLFSSELQRDGWRVISGDLSPAAARFAHAQGVRAALAFDANHGWPLADATVDAVVMLDMLEHIEHDVECLHEARRVLCHGGIAVIAVPAYPFLFSPWDAYNEHYRRYTARSLAAAAQEVGFRIERVSYWNAISLLPALVVRLKDKLIGVKLKNVEFPKVPAPVNAALIGYGWLECTWLERFPLPAGLSAWALLRRV